MLAFTIPETPRYHISRGDLDRARRALERLRRVESGAQMLAMAETSASADEEPSQPGMSACGRFAGALFSSTHKTRVCRSISSRRSSPAPDLRPSSAGKARSGQVLAGDAPAPLGVPTRPAHRCAEHRSGAQPLACPV